MTTQAWYRDDSDDKLYESHVKDPPHYLTAQEVFERSGVQLSKVKQCDDPDVQANLRKEGGYNHFDWLEISRELMPDFDQQLKKYYAEHLHKDHEIRLITKGSAYFEIRDFEDRWIRLHVQRCDLIQLPLGIYHRLTLDKQNYVKMLRLFAEVPKWESVNRPHADAHPARLEYLNTIPTGKIKA